MPVLRSWFLSWRRRRKKEVESGVFGFSEQELEIYKLNFPQEIEFLKHDLLAKSILTNLRC